MSLTAVMMMTMMMSGNCDSSILAQWPGMLCFVMLCQAWLQKNELSGNNHRTGHILLLFILA